MYNQQRRQQEYVSIRQHTSAYVSIRLHTSAYASIRDASKSIITHSVGGAVRLERQGPVAAILDARKRAAVNVQMSKSQSARLSCRCVALRHHHAYVSTRQHT
jgi:hypothetical protein